MTVCFNFSSGLKKNITIRNKVAVIGELNDKDCYITVLTDEMQLKKVLTGLSNPVSSIASGDMQIDGNQIEFLQFLSKFR